jgi:hypothetical protein
MLPEEAQWLGDRIASRADQELFPFLNVGSSTETFRTLDQPYIDAEIFAPLGRRGGEARHLDMKSAGGVDFVGDILDLIFVSEVRGTFAPRCVLVSNLLEHVLDPASVAEAAASFVPAGGLIIVSGPRSYPFHPDPIDNGFRPTVPEVHSLFPHTRLIDAEIVVSDTWRPWSHLTYGRWNAMVFCARLALPVYRPTAWRRRMDAFPYAFRRASAYAVLLAKEGAGESVAVVA